MKEGYGEKPPDFSFFFFLIVCSVFNIHDIYVARKVKKRRGAVSLFSFFFMGSVRTPLYMIVVEPSSSQARCWRERNK